MFARLVHRLLHFVIYAVLLITRLGSYRVQRAKNSLLWTWLSLTRGFAPAEAIIAERCTHGQLLGSKKLSHAALIVNELHKDVNLPSQEQVARLADVIMWLMLSLDRE